MPLSTLDPTPALVVIDLQKGIVSDTVAHVVPHAAALAKTFRQHELPVVLVNVTGRAPGRTDAGGHGGIGTLPAGWADIIDELERQPGDYLINPFDAAKLKVKWTFAYPASVRARSRRRVSTA